MKVRQTERPHYADDKPSADHPTSQRREQEPKQVSTAIPVGPAISQKRDHDDPQPGSAPLLLEPRWVSRGNACTKHAPEKHARIKNR